MRLVAFLLVTACGQAASVDEDTALFADDKAVACEAAAESGSVCASGYWSCGCAIGRASATVICCSETTAHRYYVTVSLQ